MGVKVGASEVGVYLGAEKLAGLGGGVTLEPFQHNKRTNTYTYLYFDCGEGATLHISGVTLGSGSELHVRIGDDLTFDDANENTLTGLALGNIASGEEKDFIVSGHRYASIQYINASGSAQRYAASGSCTISGAQAVKAQ